MSQEANDLLAASDVVDLHVESFIWPRVFGYDLTHRHHRNLTGGRLWGQADLPRLAEAGVTGAVMSIATNPLRTAGGRRKACVGNVAALGAVVASAPGVEVVADAAGYHRARAAGRLACFVALQGGNALRADDLDDPTLARVSRITLMHLTRSSLGSTSAPAGGRGGLTAAGRALVAAMVRRHVVLDLAHASPATFWDALDAHGGAAGPIVSHTGVRAGLDHWRNLDDDQIRAIADRGGVVGILFHRAFLRRPGRHATAADVVRHLAHVVRVGGEGAAAIGSDYDGFIVPPPDLRTVAGLPNLVQAMLDARFPPARIQAILGANALRSISAVRPG